MTAAFLFELVELREQPAYLIVDGDTPFLFDDQLLCYPLFSLVQFLEMDQRQPRFQVPHAMSIALGTRLYDLRFESFDVRSYRQLTRQLRRCIGNSCSRALLDHLHNLLADFHRVDAEGLENSDRVAFDLT